MEHSQNHQPQMLTTQFLLLALTATLPAHALTVGKRITPVITCDTTSGSPTTEDVTLVINQAKGDGSKLCGNDNDFGSHCTTVEKQGTAGIAVCGTDNYDSLGVGFFNCDNVGLYATEIQTQCQSGSLAGGSIQLGDGTKNNDYRIELIRV